MTVASSHATEAKCQPCCALLGTRRRTSIGLRLEACAGKKINSTAPSAPSTSFRTAFDLRHGASSRMIVASGHILFVSSGNFMNSAALRAVAGFFFRVAPAYSVRGSLHYDAPRVAQMRAFRSLAMGSGRVVPLWPEVAARRRSRSPEQSGLKRRRPDNRHGTGRLRFAVCPQTCQTRIPRPSPCR